MPSTAFVTASRRDALATGYGNMPQWAETDLLAFWRAADRFERANGSTYREMVIAQPNELDAQTNVILIVRLVKDLIGNKLCQYALHASEARLGEDANTHAYVMLSDRLPDGIVRSPEVTSMRSTPGLPARCGCKKDSGGKSPMHLRDDVVDKRKRVANIQNQTLAACGTDARVEHCSHNDRGIHREPEQHLGQARIRNMSSDERAAYIAERQGGSH